jgi:HSP20 family molecular chaperone IbpA
MFTHLSNLESSLFNEFRRSESKKAMKTESKSVRESRDRERTIRPPVDIFEDEAGITLLADMPGVSKEELTVQVDSDTLSIEGKAQISMPETMQALHADMRTTNFQRSFSLSRELDGSKAEASLKDGVLTLRIPKGQQYQSRNIEVRAG